MTPIGADVVTAAGRCICTTQIRPLFLCSFSQNAPFMDKKIPKLPTFDLRHIRFEVEISSFPRRKNWPHIGKSYY